MKIGIYVGSFNPVHVGHISIVNHLLSKYLDKVIVIPTGNYWNKTDLVSIEHRINMLKFYESDNIIIDTENNMCEYTYQVFDNLSKVYTNDSLSLIIGADNIVNFDKWVNSEELLKYNLVILNRDDIDVKYYLNKLNKKDKYVIVSDLANIDISSTMIRKYINENNYDMLDSIIDKDILNYILNNNLYK